MTVNCSHIWRSPRTLRLLVSWIGHLVMSQGPDKLELGDILTVGYWLGHVLMEDRGGDERRGTLWSLLGWWQGRGTHPDRGVGHI